MSPHRSVSMLLFLALAASTTYAQFVQQGPPLVGNLAVGGALQGESVAISADGNTAIVGGPGDNSFAGAVWIFTRINGLWSQQGPKLVGSGAVGPAQQGFGVAISADGNTVIEGGPGDDSYGAAWVFTRTNDVWSQQGNKLVGAGGTGQGLSVALSSDGNTAVVGSPSDNNQTGAVWVFTRSNSVWSPQGPKLIGSGTTAASQGRSVAISGDGNTLAETGPYDNTSVGATWIFTRTNGVWSQQAKLVGTSASYQGFGVALSVDGNTVISGGGSGASIFARSNSVWSQQTYALAGSGATSQQVTGVGLSGDGNTAILGDIADNNEAGAAWIFVRIAGAWYQLGSKMVGSGAVAPFQDQGQSVALSADGKTAIVGGPGHLTTTPGASWIYTRLPILYILDSGNHLIWMYDTHGNPVFYWNNYAVPVQPSGLAVDAAGYLWLTDSSLNQVVKQDDRLIFRFGTTGSAPGQFYHPNGLAIDSLGNVWVADTGNNRIQEFDGNGNYLQQVGGLGGGNGQFNAPAGIAIDPSGNIWVADTGNNRIQEFDSTGRFLLKFGSFGNAGGLFEGPFSIAFDPSGNAWIADPYNQRIQEFNSSGVFLQAFGGGFSFPSPYGIAVDFLGNVWGVDYNLSHIAEFSSSGAPLFQFGTIGGYSNGQFGQFYHPTYIVAR